MLLKKPLGGKKVQVTFTMPPLDGVETLRICGDFNNWSETATVMMRGADGSWNATLILEAGRSYLFRYHDDKGQWRNDPAADAYVPNEFGSENSVLDLAAPAASAPPISRKKAPARKNKRPSPQKKGPSASHPKTSARRPAGKKRR
jgi:1,4-alpha-glucan branching enzyme